MLHISILLIAILVLAWILPWRDLKVWRASIILLVFGGAAFIAYEYRGYSDGLATKQALAVFDHQPSEKNLTKVHSHLAKHIEKHTDDALAYVILGRLHFAEKNYSDAADAFAVAYKDYEHDPDLWIEYAAALMLGGSDPDTLSDLVKKLGARK